MEVIEAEKRGTTLYVYENYLFRKSRSSMNGDKLYVTCVFNGCKATGQIKRDEFIPRKCHNHGPEELRIQKLRLRADLRKVAEKHRGPGMKRAYDEACERYQNAAEFVSYNAFKSTMYRTKQVQTPPNPQDLTDYANILSREEGGHWAKTIEEQRRPFFHKLIENNKDDWKAVIFICPTLSSLMETTNTVLVDGRTTYEDIMLQLRAYQLFTVHVLHMGHFFPVMYALISRKTEACYRGVLGEVVINVCPGSRASVHTILSDYDSGMMKAAAFTWPHATVVGCFFHFVQAVYHKHISENMTELTKHSVSARTVLRMLMALVLLPAHLMGEGLDLVWQYTVLHELQSQFRPLFEYMRAFWLTAVGPDTCSVYNQLHRTTNALEAFYFQLQRIERRPSIWEFTGGLQMIQRDAAADVSRLNSGSAVKCTRKKRQALQDKQIRKAWAMLEGDRYSLMEVLTELAHAVMGLEERLRSESLSAVHGSPDTLPSSQQELPYTGTLLNTDSGHGGTDK
uniref:MULE transposase domain-containing protein n=1 Tax=Homalodisca liturata TaxID=320908 RepID=A0A1B6I4A9_9HEMI